MLRVEALSAGYGRLPVIREASFAVAQGDMVGLIGRNGAGKTTLISSIMGLLPRTSGGVFLNGVDLSGMSPDKRARAGIGFSPAGGKLFKSLTVRDNLLIGVENPAEANLAFVTDLFPDLVPLLGRYAGNLSGGERQMVAIGRALMLKPRILLLDEPSEGLAPIVVLRLVDALIKLKKTGICALIAEQNSKFAEMVCHQSYYIEKGHVSVSRDHN